MQHQPMPYPKIPDQLAAEVDLRRLTAAAAFRSEAVVHELVHLKVPNNGRLFRSLRRSHLGKVDPIETTHC